MTATILSFGRRQPNIPPLPAKTPWQNQDLAELYRVRDRLCSAGLEVEVEAGVTDEGDPWFVYAQAGTDNVVVHIARIDSEIHVINCVTGGAYVGTSFREVSDRMLEEAPLALSTQVRRSSNVVLHPSAFLTAFVAAALMLIDLLENNKAEAATHHDAADASHASAWTITTGGAPHEANHSADGEAATAADRTDGAEPADAAMHRRSAKDAPTSMSSPLASPGTAPVSLAAAGFAGLSAHGGFLAEVPGVGASVTLAAGILAAELARSFTGEGEHHPSDGGAGSGGLARDFASLLSAFASAEPAHAKAALPELAPGAAGLAASAATVGSAESVPAPHVNVASLASIGAAVSVKSAPDGFVEHAVFVAQDAHKPLPASAAPAPAPAQASAQASAAAHDPARTAPSAAPSDSAPAVTVTTPAAATAPAPSAAPASATAVKAEVAKDAGAPDLGWIVSQLVKHGSGADLTQTLTNALASAKDGAALTLVSDAGSGSAKGSGGLTLSLVGDKLPGLDLGLGTSKTGDAAKTGTTKPAAGSADGAKGVGGTASAGETPERGSLASDAAKPDAAAKTDGTVHLTPGGGTITLQIGAAETVSYKTGSTLTLANFVLGEDYLRFEGKVGDEMAAKAHADGADLVLGDADTGTVRLVGVLSEPSLLSHAHDTRASAA